MKRRKKEVLVKNCTIFLALICLGLIFLSNGYAVITDLHLTLNYYFMKIQIGSN